MRSKNHSKRDEDHHDDEVDVDRGDPTNLLILHDVHPDRHDDATEATARTTRRFCVRVDGVADDILVIAWGACGAGTPLACTAATGMTNEPSFS
jgi:hypothetical protein